VGAQYLPLGVLEDGTDDLGDARQGHPAGVLAVEEEPPAQFPLVTAGDEAVDAADERGLAAPTGASDEEQFATGQRQGDLVQGGLGAGTIAKGKALDRQWSSSITLLRHCIFSQWENPCGPKKLRCGRVCWPVASRA